MRSCTGPGGTFGNRASTCIQRCSGAGNDSVYSIAGACAHAGTLTTTTISSAKKRLAITVSLARIPCMKKLLAIVVALHLGSNAGAQTDRKSVALSWLDSNASRSVERRVGEARGR